MRYTRRLIAILIGCATWCIASSSVAFAKVVDDPGAAGIPAVTPSASSATPLWQILALVALGVLLIVAVGLGYSRSHSRKSQTPLRS
jgi:hypothetical protein